MSKSLRPFWNYFGGKWRAAYEYPPPMFNTIIEPFAGAAGYSIRHHKKDVILVEKDPVIASIWEFLLTASVKDILAIPIVSDIADLRGRVPFGAGNLVAFNLNTATAKPPNTLSKIHRNNREKFGYQSGWSTEHRWLCAEQSVQIKHWRVIQGDYTLAPDIAASWFIDPPYEGPAGKNYRMHDLDYPALGEWCLSRKGQVTVCENKGAEWLPFRDSYTARPSISKAKPSQEVIWSNHVYFGASYHPDGRLRRISL